MLDVSTRRRCAMDLSGPLEAAARARWESARRGLPHLPGWEELSRARQDLIREDLLPSVEAAARIVEKAVRADIEAQHAELAWRRRFVEITAPLVGELRWPDGQAGEERAA
jgi:hypothetical protein